MVPFGVFKTQRNDPSMHAASGWLAVLRRKRAVMHLEEPRSSGFIQDMIRNRNNMEKGHKNDDNSI